MSSLPPPSDVIASIGNIAQGAAAAIEKVPGEISSMIQGLGKTVQQAPVSIVNAIGSQNIPQAIVNAPQTIPSAVINVVGSQNLPSVISSNVNQFLTPPPQPQTDVSQFANRNFLNTNPINSNGIYSVTPATYREPNAVSGAAGLIVDTLTSSIGLGTPVRDYMSSQGQTSNAPYGGFSYGSDAAQKAILGVSPEQFEAFQQTPYFKNEPLFVQYGQGLLYNSLSPASAVKAATTAIEFTVGEAGLDSLAAYAKSGTMLPMVGRVLNSPLLKPAIAVGLGAGAVNEAAGGFNISDGSIQPNVGMSKFAVNLGGLTGQVLTMGGISGGGRFVSETSLPELPKFDFIQRAKLEVPQFLEETKGGIPQGLYDYGAYKVGKSYRANVEIPVKSFLQELPVRSESAQSALLKPYVTLKVLGKPTIETALGKASIAGARYAYYGEIPEPVLKAYNKYYIGERLLGEPVVKETTAQKVGAVSKPTTSRMSTSVVGGKTVRTLAREPSFKSMGKTESAMPRSASTDSSLNIGQRMDFRGSQGPMKPMSGVKQAGGMISILSEPLPMVEGMTQGKVMPQERITSKLPYQLGLSIDSIEESMSSIHKSVGQMVRPVFEVPEILKYRGQEQVQDRIRIQDQLHKEIQEQARKQEQIQEQIQDQLQKQDQTQKQKQEQTTDQTTDNPPDTKVDGGFGIPLPMGFPSISFGGGSIPAQQKKKKYKGHLETISLGVLVVNDGGMKIGYTPDSTPLFDSVKRKIAGKGATLGFKPNETSLFKPRSPHTPGSLGVKVNDRDIFNSGSTTRLSKKPLNRLPTNYIPTNNNVPKPRAQVVPMGLKSTVPKNNLPTGQIMAPLRKGRRKGLSSDLGSSYV